MRGRIVYVRVTLFFTTIILLYVLLRLIYLRALTTAAPVSPGSEDAFQLKEKKLIEYLSHYLSTRYGLVLLAIASGFKPASISLCWVDFKS